MLDKIAMTVDLKDRKFIPLIFTKNSLLLNLTTYFIFKSNKTNFLL